MSSAKYRIFYFGLTLIIVDFGARGRDLGHGYAITDHYIPQYSVGCNDLSMSLSGVPDYFGRNKISSGGDLSHYSSASLY